MASVVVKKGSLSVRAYRGDAKTLLAFNLTRTAARRLAGFTVQVTPPGMAPYYLLNQLQFKRPADHAQDASLPSNSSLNAPIHKFRWLHVPGTSNQGPDPIFGVYKYTVSPRYFDDDEKLTPLDPALSATVSLDVAPFANKKVSVGFTRGFVQSQAFVRHFGLDAKIQPTKHDLIFDTTAVSGKDAKGKVYTFEDQYRWLGFTARQRILDILDQVIADKTLTLDVFAYDLNEPDVLQRLLKLARRGSVRVILDNAALHTSTASKTSPEDGFEKMFNAAAKPPAELLRGHFQRYSHDKVLIVYKGKKPRTVLTGSTNLSVTGLYVNSNHVLVFEDAVVAGKYAEVFESAWTDKTSAARFRKSPLSLQPFTPSSNKSVGITFSPHDEATAKGILKDMAARIAAEGSGKAGSVLFAVMDVAGGSGDVLPALKKLHASGSVFSYGISDNPGGIALYKPGNKTGVLVTGKPINTKLPPPFSQVPGVGLGHQVHHKFVVCGFNGSDPVVYCGSSNLAEGGEIANGDNLLAIHDEDIATAFALEAVALVDHFDFLDSVASGPKAKKTRNRQPDPSKPQAAVDAGWFLSTTDGWTKKYYDATDLKSADRQLFA